MGIHGSPVYNIKKLRESVHSCKSLPKPFGSWINVWNGLVKKMDLENLPSLEQKLPERWNFKRLLTDFKGTIRQKKVLGCVSTSNSNRLKTWKPSYRKKKMCVRVVNEYADTRFSNFAIEYVRENEKVRDNVLVCLYGAKVKSFKQKMVENLVTPSL